MSNQSRFKVLGDLESPMLGLFFFEAEENLNRERRVNLAIDRPLATGMGALVSETGLVVTCAHVILALDGWPGRRVTLFGASPSVCIEVQAEVCDEGWRGPVLDERGARMRNPFWRELWDNRPDVFREDLAFLRIIPETACWHSRREAVVMPTHPTAADALHDCSRVLPACRAGYRRAGSTLSAWCVTWNHGAPECHAGQATYQSFDVEGHHAVRVVTTAFRPGYSGSPLWDERRRTVVGLVRRALPSMNEVLGNMVLCTDALAFLAHTSIRLTPDARLRALETYLASRLLNISPERYADLSDVDADHIYIEPQVVRVRGRRDPLKDSEPEEPLPAIEFFSANLKTLKRVVIRGAAGIGKSLLLRKLATTLIERASYDTGLRIVPILLTASELSKSGADIGRCLEAIWLEARNADMEDGAVDVLSENGAALAVFVDGLDEIPDREHASVLARLDIRRFERRGAFEDTSNSGYDRYIAVTAVTTRPSDAWEASGRGTDSFPPSRLQLFELLRFDEERIDEFCSRVFQKSELRLRFRNELRKVRWANEKATPLQLRMAASVFSWKGALPERSVDLTAHFVDRAIDRARKEFEHRYSRTLRDEVRDLYLPHVHEILGFAAEASLESGSEGLDEECFVKAFETMRKNRSFLWAVNLGSLTDFLYRDFYSYLTLFVPRNEHRLGWAHRTFAELLSAEHTLLLHGSSATLRDRFFEILNRGKHGRALSLLGVIDRTGDDSTSTEILQRCMSDAGPTGSRPQLFALRALGAGLDAKGRARSAQVALLVKYLVSDVREGMLCEQLFTQDDLPDAKELLAYPELTEDIFRAMLRRFKPRLDRATSSRPAVVLTREAMVLRHAKLWPRFLDLGLRRPPSDDQSETPGIPTAEVISDGPESFARVLMRGRDGSTRIITLRAADFVSALAEVARQTPGGTPVAELIEFAINLQAKP